jgi:hypothetical protein
MQKMFEIVMVKTGTSIQFSMLDIKYPPIQVNARSSVASRISSSLTLPL